MNFSLNIDSPNKSYFSEGFVTLDEARSKLEELAPKICEDERYDKSENYSFDFFQLVGRIERWDDANDDEPILIEEYRIRKIWGEVFFE